MRGKNLSMHIHPKIFVGGCWRVGYTYEQIKFLKSLHGYKKRAVAKMVGRKAKGKSYAFKSRAQEPPMKNNGIFSFLWVLVKSFFSKMSKFGR